jgi:hypothetical protein
MAHSQIDGGFKLENAAGLRFNGISFDDNQNGKGSYQAQNVCMLARYGNKGDFGSRGSPTDQCKGTTGGTIKGPHYYGEGPANTLPCLVALMCPQCNCIHTHTHTHTHDVGYD